MSIAAIPRSKADLPTHLDLPCEDGKPMENTFQPPQSALLSGCFNAWLTQNVHPHGDFLLGADNGIYWKLTEDRLSGCRAPDWFYVPGVPKLLDGRMRRSYVLWQEEVPPELVIEYVSGDGSEERDDTPETGKFWIYEQMIQAKYYLIWDPERCDLEAYERGPRRYRVMKPNRERRYAIPSMKAEFGLWEGHYQGFYQTWLRPWDSTGLLIPCGEEQAEAERQRADEERARAAAERAKAVAERARADAATQRAETERQRAELERQRADALAAKLRELGVDPAKL